MGLNFNESLLLIRPDRNYTSSLWGILRIMVITTLPAEKSAKHSISQKFVPARVSIGLLVRRQADMFKYFVCNYNCKHKRKPYLSFDVCLKATCNQINAHTENEISVHVPEVQKGTKILPWPRLYQFILFYIKETCTGINMSTKGINLNIMKNCMMECDTKLFLLINHFNNIVAIATARCSMNFMT